MCSPPPSSVCVSVRGAGWGFDGGLRCAAARVSHSQAVNSTKCVPQPRRRASTPQPLERTADAAYRFVSAREVRVVALQMQGVSTEADVPVLVCALRRHTRIRYVVGLHVYRCFLLGDALQPFRRCDVGCLTRWRLCTTTIGKRQRKQPRNRGITHCTAHSCAERHADTCSTTYRRVCPSRRLRVTESRHCR